MKIFLERVENIVGKGENAGYQHFLLFSLCFQMASFSGLFKVEWERVKQHSFYCLQPLLMNLVQNFVVWS